MGGQELIFWTLSQDTIQKAAQVPLLTPLCQLRDRKLKSAAIPLPPFLFKLLNMLAFGIWSTAITPNFDQQGLFSRWQQAFS